MLCILLFEQGSPTPGSWRYETNSVESRLDQNLWSKSLSPRKSIRFFPKDEDTEDKSDQKKNFTSKKDFNKKDKIMSTLKPKLKSILKKYASTTIDPLQLIKKYRKSLKSTTLPSTISRKYPTKFVVSEKKTKDESTTSDTNAYTKYTTSSSFRTNDEHKKHTSKQPTREEIKFHGTSTFGEKLFTTEEISQKPTVPSMKPEEEENDASDSKYIPTPLPIEERREEESADAMPSPFNIEEYQKRKSFHTTLVPVKLHKVSVAPTNMILLDDYYNKKVMGLQRRRLSKVKETPKGFGQSLKDIFFPNTPARRIIKVKKSKARPFLTTMKPIYTTLKAIQNKFPSILIDPYKQLRKNKPSTRQDKLIKKQGDTEDDEDNTDFPYKFHKPISSVEKSTPPDQEYSRSSLSIDRQLVSPSDPGVDIQEAVKTYLPALLSIGTGLGIALHTLVSSWDSHIQAGMLPQLAWTGDTVSITYQGTTRDNTRDNTRQLIPITIDSSGT